MCFGTESPITRYAPSDRTMVNIVLLAASCTLQLCHLQQRKLTRWTTSRTCSEVTKHSGLDLEKEISPPVEAELFFLTSLFIELIELCDVWALDPRVNECKRLITSTILISCFTQAGRNSIKVKRSV